MRAAPALAVLLAATALAAAQERPQAPDEVPPRYGLPYRPKVYPQESPKKALESVIAAADRGEFGYLAAHLLDPAFVDARLADRVKQLQPGVAVELTRLREFQRMNPTAVPPGTRLPDDDTAFRARIAQEATQEAFRQFVRDVQEKQTEDPEALKDLRRFARQGTFPDPDAAGDAAKITVPELKDRAVFLKKIGDRWFVENRQAEERTPEPKKD